MNKQYMTIQFGQRTATVRTNSEKAIKNALGKVYQSTHGTVKSFVIKGDVIEFEATTQKEKFGYWKPTDTYRARIIENTFATEETAEVVEAPAAEVVEETVEAAEVVEAPAVEVVEAPAVEVVEVSTEEHTVTMTVEEKRAAWDIFIKEWAKGHADALHSIRAANAKAVN